MATIRQNEATTRAFDAAEYLDSPEMIAEYLTEALETLSAKSGMICGVESWFRGYAVLATAQRAA